MEEKDKEQREEGVEQDESFTIEPKLPQKSQEKATSSSIKKGYSEKELQLLYELGKLFLETGQLSKAEVIFTGICEVAPLMEWAQMGLAIIYILQGEYELALKRTELVQKISPNNLNAMLLQAIIYLCREDYPRAGTILGEINEKLQEGLELEPPAQRIYKMQLARYHSRQK
ncbi:MAG: hypothetical protein D6780_01610 [Candidatus Dadabacteria bacterium]|nr:MAG: hypothetical protein D6780_01610 [Candidatus Dadabacteria bacterium]